LTTINQASHRPWGHEQKRIDVNPVCPGALESAIEVTVEVESLLDEMLIGQNSSRKTLILARLWIFTGSTTIAISSVEARRYKA